MGHSKRKMEVNATTRMPPEYGGKRWVRVKMLRSNVWIPSFEDLYRIVRAIGICEDEKYPNGKGRDMIWEFIQDALHFPEDLRESDYPSLAKRYKIPERCGVTVELGGNEDEEP